MIKKSGWIAIPTAFFLFLNFAVSSAKILFVSRLTYFLFLLSLFFILRRFDISRILKTVTAGISIIVFSYGLIQKYLLFPIYLRELTAKDNFYSQAAITRIKSGRIFSIFSLPTLYAIICTVLILFIFHYMLDARKKGQKLWPLWGLLLMLGLFNLILTQSFGGILYLMVGGLTYLLLSGILELKYLAPTLMVLSLFFFITMALRYSEVKELEPVKLRFSNWVQAGRIISDHPVWGVGLGNYENKISYYTYSYEAKSIYAHNFFLQFTAETGILLPFILLFILLAARKKLIPKNVREKSVFVSAASILLCYNLIDIGFYFFAAGVISALVLSQMYPAAEKSKVPAGLWSVFIVLSLLLGIEGLSSGQRKKADFLQAQEQHEFAEDHYRNAININPYNFKAMTGLASLALGKVQLTVTPELEHFLDRSLALNPDSASASYLKSRFLYRKEHHIKALYYAVKACREKNQIRHHLEWYKLLQHNLERAINQAKPWNTGQTGAQDKIK